MHASPFHVRPLLAVILALSAGAVGAADPVLLEAIGGFELSGADRSYAFVTAGAAPAVALGLRMPVRLTASDLRYSFESGGTTTAVHSPGATLLAGLGLRGERSGLALTGGGELRRERRRVEGSSDPATVDVRPGAVIQLEGDRAMGLRLHVFALVSFAGASRYTYARLAVRRQLSNLQWRGPLAVFAGIEGSGQGNAETRAAQAGGSIEITFARAQLSLGAHAGLEESGSPGEPRRRTPYAALSVYQRY
jgi:hypothetical protein